MLSFNAESFKIWQCFYSFYLVKDQAWFDIKNNATDHTYTWILCVCFFLCKAQNSSVFSCVWIFSLTIARFSFKDRKKNLLWASRTNSTKKTVVMTWQKTRHRLQKQTQMSKILVLKANDITFTWQKHANTKRNEKVKQQKLFVDDRYEC